MSYYEAVRRAEAVIAAVDAGAYDSQLGVPEARRDAINRVNAGKRITPVELRDLAEAGYDDLVGRAVAEDLIAT